MYSPIVRNYEEMHGDFADQNLLLAGGLRSVGL
jgi:hypothetical protein